MQPIRNLSPAAPRPTNRLWMVFFLLLAAMGAFAVIVPLVTTCASSSSRNNWRKQRERWKQNGPLDYDLLWQEKRNEDPRPDQYLAVVRDGRVWLVQINSDVLMAQELATPLAGAAGTPVAALATERPPQHDLTGYTVEGLFHTIDDNLKKNTESGGRNFATASFDPKDGHPLRYIYRVKRTPERLEWNVKLQRQ